jgi:WD40 repeat protein
MMLHEVFNSASFSPDSHLILTAAGNTTARLWDTDYQETVRTLCARLLRDFSAEERTQYGISDAEPICTKSSL